MRLRHFSSLFIVVSTSVIVSGSSNVYQSTFTLSKQVAREGEELTAVCDVNHVTQEGKESFFIIFVKKTLDSNQLVEIATNNHINTDFNNTGRYAGNYVMEIPGDTRRVTFFLNISDLHSEDSGALSCKLGTNEAKDFKDFIVQVPVQKIWWTTVSDENDMYSDGETVFLKEGDSQQFACHINGSLPEATVQVFLGQKDITHLFEIKSSLKHSDGPKGLKPLFYRTDVVSKSTIIGYHNMTEMLKCVAKVSALDDSKVTSISVNLTEYSPKFICVEKMQAKLYEQYFNLTCRVHASPSVTDAKFHWISGDNDNDTLEVGVKSSDISANMTEGEAKDEVVMVMTIYRVSLKHFQRKYIFEAENDVRRVKHIIQLEQDTSPKSKQQSNGGGGQSQPPVKMTLLMLLSALLFFTSV